MKKLFLTFYITILGLNFLIGQCDCYKIDNFKVPVDTSEFIEITFSNSCHEVYLNCVIKNRLNGDTIAYSDCTCLTTNFENTTWTVTPGFGWQLNYDVNEIPSPSKENIQISLSGSIECEDIEWNTTSNLTTTEENGNIVVSPNPTSDIVNVKIMDRSFRNYTVKVFDMAGVVQVEKLLKTPLSEVDLSILTNGLYIMSFYSRNQFMGNRYVIKY